MPIRLPAGSGSDARRLSGQRRNGDQRGPRRRAAAGRTRRRLWPGRRRLADHAAVAPDGGEPDHRRRARGGRGSWPARWAPTSRSPDDDVAGAIRDLTDGLASTWPSKPAAAPARSIRRSTRSPLAARCVVCSWYGTKPVQLTLGGAFHRRRLRIVSSQVSTIDAALQPRWTHAATVGARARPAAAAGAGLADQPSHSDRAGAEAFAWSTSTPIRPSRLC